MANQGPHDALGYSEQAPEVKVKISDVVPNYVQIFDDTKVSIIEDDEFRAANFFKLCPSQNCVHDCKNLTRVFQAVPDGVDIEPDKYGRPDAENSVTFFGVCTNLNRATGLSDPPIMFFFPNTQEDDVIDITSKIATCFASTCDLTREPDKCQKACAMDNVQARPGDLNFNLEESNAGVLICVKTLCESTCGLPYVNQDVFGPGVIASYGIQALLLLFCSFYMFYLACPSWSTLAFMLNPRRRDKPAEGPEIRPRVKLALESFLMLQTYFGVSVGFATIAVRENKDDPENGYSDPMNGYALLCVSIIGFLPPVFTMMLLHSRGIKGRFLTFMVFAGYMINSVPFWMLFEKMRSIQGNREASMTTIAKLFQAGSCGGSSVMSLCQQLTGMEPMTFSDLFLSKEPLAVGKFAPVIWGWTTAILLILILCQVRDEIVEKRARENPVTTSAAREPGWFEVWRWRSIHGPRRLFWLRIIATLVFILALGWQTRVIVLYRKMGLLNRDGWTFGQLVAVLFWAPPIIETLHQLFKHYVPPFRKAAPQDDDSTKPETTEATHPLLPELNLRTGSSFATFKRRRESLEASRRGLLHRNPSTDMHRDETRPIVEEEPEIVVSRSPSPTISMEEGNQRRQSRDVV